MTKDIFVISRCTVGEIHWEVPINLRPRDDEEKKIIVLALEREDTQVTLSRFCPFCQQDHDFCVNLSDISEQQLIPGPTTTFRPCESPSGHPVVMDLLPLPYRTPIDAAMLYNDGGLFVRNDDRPEILEKGLIMLKLSQEIYEENKLYREAAYAATVAAEAHFKLGNRLKARELLDFALPHLGEERDQRLRNHWQWVRDRLDTHIGDCCDFR